MIQLDSVTETKLVPHLASAISDLLADEKRRSELGSNALSVMQNNRGAVSRTMEYLDPLFSGRKDR